MAQHNAEHIQVHLAYELKFLLVAATTWEAARRDELRHAHRIPHLMTMSMESAFVHTRALCEFLAEPKTDQWARLRVHEPVRIPLWDVYCTPMHDKVLHLNPRRPYRSTGELADGLKDQVIELARAVLVAWDEVAAQPTMEALAPSMAQARKMAITEGRMVAEHFGVPAVFD